ncbi:hypothetical protein [Psychrobacillus sp. NPDC096623]|uniref:hypothetical protein n=1 Tax=Psychrobacillus sp. NPDC096623 TaxID=3364492 RepID=UPI0037F28B6A
MQNGRDDYQIHDSYFIVVGEGFIFILIGVLIITGIITFSVVKKISSKRKEGMKWLFN